MWGRFVKSTKNLQFGELSQTLVWGKQSVRLSAAAFPNPEGRTGRKPKPTLRRKGNLMRKRNKTITIRVTEEEWCAIMKQVLKAGMNVTDYLVTAATNAQIYVAEDTKPLIAELKRIGNNLNQITAKIHAGAFHSYNFYEVIEMQRAIYEEVLRIGRGE
jgi:hypothetical protein